MGFLTDQIEKWLKGILVDGIMNNLTGMFTNVNDKVGSIANDVAQTPQDFSPGIFAMIRTVSESVIMPVAGIILTFVACYELIAMVTEHNNLAQLDTWIFFKWIFKTFVAVLLISNTFAITMAVFDMAKKVIQESAGIISYSTMIDDTELAEMRTTIEAMNLGPLFGLLIQSLIVQVGMYAISVVIFVIIYGRMIEIYLVTSLAPIPFATFGSREQSHIGQNYLRSLLALGFQGFLIIICVGIYAVLIQSVAFSSDIIGSLWGVMGYSILLCFTLFKSGIIAKSILSAH